MKEIKTFVETHFDTVFSEKPDIEYEFDIRRMSWKGRMIIRSLLKHGIKGKKCLDVGPGTGRCLQFLKRNHASYLGAVDISEESLGRGSKLCNKTQKADVETDKFGFESNFFDIVISIEILEHLRNPESYLSEIVRVTKNGGIILMSIPNIVSFISRIRMLFGLLPTAIASDKTHVRFYRKKDIVRLFAPLNLLPQFIPTYISLNPFNRKSWFSIPSTKLLSSFDDSLLFLIHVVKQ